MFWYFGWLFVIIVVLCIIGIIYASVKGVQYYSTDYSSLFSSSMLILLITLNTWLSYLNQVMPFYFHKKMHV